jgi:diguanylate cyclase (GGDEF)-like protein
VLATLLQKVGLDTPNVGDATRSTLEAWQREWESGEFDRNIPVTLTDDDMRMVGFPAQAELDAFLTEGGDSSIHDFAAACIMKPRQRILLLEHEVDAIQQFFTLMNFNDIVVLESDTSLQEAVAQAPPDLVVVNLELLGPSAAAVIRRIKLDETTRDCPVIAIAPEKNSDEEVVLFEAGAADYISRPVHDLVLQARLNLHMERKRSKDLLDRMARYDELTEILNRRSFNVALQAEWSRSRRNNTPLALLMIDVDRFKNYNDRYGHDLGDQCLRQVARSLQECLKRPTDQLARYGGEEFVIILPDTDERGADIVARRCCRGVAEAGIPHDASDIAPHVTVSVGLATETAEEGRMPEKLAKDADRALYAAKHAGRNRVCMA